MSARELHGVALRLSERGVVVHPLEGKRPVVSGWADRTEPLTVEECGRWWGPSGGIGLPLGQANGCVCLDVDVKSAVNGLETLATLEAVFGPLPDTPRDRTPSGGLHYFFAYPDGGVQTTRRADLGLELLSDRSQVTIPPSRGYVRERSGKLAQLPVWVLDNLSAVRAGTTVALGNQTQRTGDLDPWDYVPILCGDADRTGKFHCPSPGHPDYEPSLAIYTDSNGRGFCARPEMGGTHFHCHRCKVTGRERELAALALGIYDERRLPGIPASQRLDSTERAQADELLRELGVIE